MQIILIADVTMSLDNVLAVAGAAEGNLFLLIFGLCMSIPIVVYTSNLLSILMDRYPLIIVIGGAVLGRVGGQMIMTDPFVLRWLSPGLAVGLRLPGALHGRGGGDGQALDALADREGGAGGRGRRGGPGGRE